MNLRRSTERLMENYTLGDLSRSDAEEVERVLAEGGPDGQHIQRDLDVERALEAALHVPEFEQDTASQVLDRVARRTTTQLSRKMTADLASASVEAALSDGRVTRRVVEGRHRPAAVVRWLRAAGIIALIGGAYFLVFRGMLDDSGSFLKPEQLAVQPIQQPQPARLGRIRYASLSTGADREPVFASAASSKYTSVHSEQVIETSSTEGAEVDLSRGSRLVLLPGTRVVIARGPVHASYRVRLLQGGLRVDTRGRRPLHVASTASYHGFLEGKGEVRLIEDSRLQRPLNSATAHPSMLVRVSTRKGRFENGHTQLQLKAGDLALLNLNGAVRLGSAEAGLGAAPSSSSLWMPSGLMEPDAPALILDQREFSRKEIAGEVLRSFGASAADIITRSIIIQKALDDAHLTISSARRADAMGIVRGTEHFLVQPLRSSRAIEERAFHLAGLFALENAKRSQPLPFNTQTALAAHRTGWNRLSSRLQVNWGGSAESTAFTISYSGSDVLVLRDEVWRGLRAFMRLSELEQFIGDIVERESVRLWLKGRGEEMPRPDVAHLQDPRLAAAMRSMMVMEGRTEASVTDRETIRAAILPSVREPSELEVDQYLQDSRGSLGQVVFEQVSFPFAEDDGGASDPSGRESKKTLALAAALTARSNWLEGRSPATTQGSTQGDSFLWPASPSPRIGPRAWWPDVYGASFTGALLSLNAEEISEPIEGPEAWHLLRVHNRRTLQLDGPQSRRVAKRVLTYERIQRRLRGILARRAVERPGVSSLLRD